MYFWDVQSLKNDIRANKLSEKDKFLYMFLSIAFVTIGIELISISPLEPQNVWDAVESVSYILIVLFGTYWAYKANGSEHGTDFLGRYFSISFVVSVRFCTLLIPISVFLLLGLILTDDEEENRGCNNTNQRIRELCRRVLHGRTTRALCRQHGRVTKETRVATGR